MPSIESLLGDFRLAVRSLGRDKGFAVTALLTFAICLGANVALFAVVNAVLLRPLPFPDAERLVMVGNSYPKAGVPDAIGVSIPHYLERRDGVAAFAESAAWRGGGETIGEAGATDRVASMSVTPSFFRVLQAQPALGRTFTDEEGFYDKNSVVVLSDALWRSKFAADPNVVGRTVRLGGGWMCTVIGVMPPNFRFLSEKAQLWVPLCFSDDDRKPMQRHSNNMAMIARLKPDASRTEAQAQIDALNQAALAGDPLAKLATDAGFRTEVKDLHENYVAAMRPALLLLQAGVLFLLLIGVVNLTNLLLVRASGRTKELSVRQVLGAGRVRVARQLLTETLVLALGGGALGLAFGWVALHSLNLMGVDQLPRSGELRLDGFVCAVALAAALVVGVLLALPVIWHSLRGNLAAALSVESRGGTTSRATHRLRHALIVAQFALAFVLLAGAGLLGLSFSRVLSVHPGFQPDHVLTASIPLPWGNYKDEKPRIAFIERLAQELKSAPGITAAGFSSSVPFGGNTSVNAITVLGHEPKPGESLQAHHTSGATGDYFTAMGIPLREGRFINADDTARGDRVCVVDEVFARYYWPDASALGHQLLNGVREDDEKPFTIVGVVGTVKQNDLADEKPRGAVYLPYAHYATNHFSVTLRTALPPETAGPALRAAVLRVDPDVPVADMKTLASRIDESLLNRRSPVLLAGIFAGVALVLAGVGLYGVLAYTVAQRRREIGVRMALGAQPEQIRTQFLGLGARLVAAGAALGGIGSWLSGRAMNTLLYGVGPAHPLVIGSTVAILTGLALLACWLPAARATRVPPMEALRSD
ncbi:MAG TPA: ABC transporter permease [Opitutaceae bacterium]